MQHDRIDEPRIDEARALIENIREGAAVEASSERLLALIAGLIEDRDRPLPGDTMHEAFQKPLG